MTMIEKARRNRIVALIRLRVATSQPARPTTPQFRSRRQDGGSARPVLRLVSVAA